MDRRKSVDKAKYNKNTHDWEEEDLDEEMEEIFHPANDHFSLADLVERQPDAKPHFDENDYELHRRESFQYHQPLHKLYHHKHKKSSHRSEKKEEKNPQSMSTLKEEATVDPASEKEDPSEDDPLLNHKSATPSSSKKPQTSGSKDKVQFYVGSSTSLEKTALSSSKKPLKSILHAFSSKDAASSSESPPSSSKRSSEDVLTSVDEDLSREKSVDEILSSSSARSEKEKSKVKFLLGEESQNDLQKNLQVHVPEHSKHIHSKSTRRRSIKRKHHGFSIDKKYENVLEPEEAETLQTADIDDMASHRFEDPKGIGRPKINKFFSSLFNKDDSLFKFSKKKYDTQPHELLVELHELKPGEYPSDLEWRQTARWIKYEEDVELGPDRWGKPHVPPLSFHSLVKLRQFMEAGAVLLNLEESELLGIITAAVDAMLQLDQFHPDFRDKVLRTLMRRHRHVNEKVHPPLRRNSAGYGNLNLLGHDRNRSPLFTKSSRSKSITDGNHILNNGENSLPAETSILMDSHEMDSLEVTPSSKRKSVSIEREKASDSGILRRIPVNAEGVAILVGQLPELEKPASAFIRLAEGKMIPNFLEIPINIRFIYVCLGPTDTFVNYHEVGRALGTLMSNEEFRVNMYKATGVKDVLRALNVFLDGSTVVPPGKWERSSLLPVAEIRRKSLSAIKSVKKLPKKPSYDPLKRTNRLFGGFIEDIKNRYAFYKSDILDGFNFQCVASIIFIYFAAVSGAIAFGGLLAAKTKLHIGVSETLIGTAACGILFSLFAGQPLIIIGTTGPLLLFDEMLYQLKDHYSAPFLVMRVWVGFWTAVIAIIVVAAEGSVLVKFFSRFVQEIFATIISLLFIFESLSKLYSIFVENPLLKEYCHFGIFHNESSNDSEVLFFSEMNEFSFNDSIISFLNHTQNIPGYTDPEYPQPNTALLSTILMIGTFYIAFFLRHFRNSKFLGRSARRALGDFGVPIGIVIMVLIDYLIKDTYTEKLKVPEGLSPTIERSWIISPLPIEIWEAFIALIGGLLIFILLFMETQICELIISKKQLKKGSGFHIDMILIGFMEMISALLGGPWQCAATVRSISHVSSLIVWSKTHAPGELPHIVEVKEQRLTNLLVSVLVGVSVVMSPLLRQVPLAVLFGVFLYMGISALSGIHLFERFLLIFMPTKHHPDFPFVRKLFGVDMINALSPEIFVRYFVRTKKMHLYTVIQLICIAVLWIIKTYFSPAFPFGLLSMVFVHSQIKRLFTKEEFKALDGEASEDENRDEEEEDPDFYEQIVA